MFRSVTVCKHFIESGRPLIAIGNQECDTNANVTENILLQEQSNVPNLNHNALK